MPEQQEQDQKNQDDLSSLTDSTLGGDTNQESEDENKEQEEEEEEEPVFHPHKGKIMEIVPYKQITSLNFDKSYTEPTGSGKANIIYTIEDYAVIYPGVSCKLKIRRDTDRQFSDTGIEEVYEEEEDIRLREHYPTEEQRLESTLSTSEREFISEDYKDFAVESTMVSRSASDDGIYGFVTEVSHTQDKTELTIKDWGYCLEDTTKELEFKGLLRSHVMEEVSKSYGLTPIIDFTGLEDDLVDWSNKKNVSGGSSSSSDDASVNGDGSMTEDQMWEIYHSFVYGSNGTGHDPEAAWQKMGTTKGVNADCYNATAWAYYVYNFKIGIPARDVCMHSDSAPSKSHHIIQIYKNGQWIDPPQLKQNTVGLGGSSGSNFHVCREPPKNGNIPPYKDCPFSLNN